MASSRFLSQSATLKETHLVSIIDVLHKCDFPVERWPSLGPRLGLRDNYMQIMRNKTGRDAYCLRRCLSEWLNRSEVCEGADPPTWDSLCTALYAIDEVAVADKLNTEKNNVQAIAILNWHCPSLSRSLSDPVSVAKLLNEEHVITGAVLANVESTGQSLSERRTVLLAAVREAVQINYQSLQTFGTVLCKVTGNVQLGKAILSDYEIAWPYESSCIFENDQEVLDIPVLSSAVAPDNQAPLVQEDIDQWLQEGSVEVTITRINMHGPPGAGKTCAQRLILNEPPPDEAITDSTPIARPPVQATRVSCTTDDDESMEWKPVDRDALLEKLASDLKAAAASRPRAPVKSTAEPSNITPTHTTSAIDSSAIHKEDSSDDSIDDSLNAVSGNDQVKGVFDTTHTSAIDSSVCVPREDAIDDSMDDSPNAVAHMKVIDEICDSIPSAKAQLSDHWVYIIDSGGQPAYQELLPLFVRTASVNIVTIDLSKGLDGKLEFQYRIKGKIFHDSELKYTNRTFINSTVCSRAVLKPIELPHVINAPSHPMYLVLGTHFDKITEAKLSRMDKDLLSSLPEFQIDNYIIPKRLQKNIIFPVNTTLPTGEEREEVGEEISQAITNEGASFTIKMPIRWFAFELHLQTMAESSGCSILTLEEVFTAGKQLKMSEKDTTNALEYLHNATIILFFPDISGLQRIVFVDPQPILDVLSRLIALTYLGTHLLHHIAKPVPSLIERSNLLRHGLFKETLLPKLKSEKGASMFSSPHFQPCHFIELLKHLHIIAEVKDNDKGDYFLPCALKSYGNAPPTPSNTHIRPLLIIWREENDANDMEYLPVPQGMFPLTVVHLLNQKEYKVVFPQPSQYTYKFRDAISLRISGNGIEQSTFHIINRYTHIEIYFVGRKKYCSQVRELITKAIEESSADINITDSYVLAFNCPVDRKKCYCVLNQTKDGINCSSGHMSQTITSDNYWCWFRKCTGAQDARKAEGKVAASAVKSNLSTLTDALSPDMNVFRQIVTKCEEKELLTSGSRQDLLDMSTGRSLQERASNFVSQMQNRVKIVPKDLDKFLYILHGSEDRSLQTVAELIAKDYGHGLPQYKQAITVTGSRVLTGACAHTLVW